MQFWRRISLSLWLLRWDPLRGGVWARGCSVAGTRLRTAGGGRLETGIPVLLCCRAIGLFWQSRVFSGHSWRVELWTFTLALLLSLRGVDHSWLILPVCKTFSKPVLCSPLILPVPLVPCIISSFREKAAAVDPTMELHIVATSRTRQTDGAFHS